MKQQFHLSFIAFLIALVFCIYGFDFGKGVFACECFNRNEFEREFELSSAVFVGEVVEVKKSKPDAFVTIKVEKMWKGTKAKQIVVRTDNRGKACGYYFKQGEHYLIYAYKDKEDELRTSNCNRTKDVESATDDLKELAKKQEL